MNDAQDIDEMSVLQEAASSCACFWLRASSRAVTQMYDTILQPCGLKATQFTLLGAIRLLGPVDIQSLAELMAIDRTTLIRNLAVLENQHWVVPVPGKNKGVKYFLVTSAGHAAILKALPFWIEAQKTFKSRIKEKTWEELLHDIKDVVAVTHAAK